MKIIIGFECGNFVANGQIAKLFYVIL